MPLSRDSFFQQVDSLIRSEGYAAVCIAADEDAPSFAYTVGLTETYGSPELLIFGVGEQIASVVFRAVVARIRAGTRFADGELLVDVLNLPCAVRTVTAEAAHRFAFNVWTRYEGTDHRPKFQQVVYPDRSSVFPWEENYDEGMRPVQTELWAAAH